MPNRPDPAQGCVIALAFSVACWLAALVALWVVFG